MNKRSGTLKESQKFEVESQDSLSEVSSELQNDVPGGETGGERNRRPLKPLASRGNARIPSFAGESTDDPNLAHLQLEMSRIDTLLAFAVERWQQAGRDPNDAFRGLVVTDDEAQQLLALPFASNWGDMVREQTISTEENTRVLMERMMREAEELADASVAQGELVRLEHLKFAFSLDWLELNAFLLALAPALDLRYEQLYSYLQNDINRKRPTVSLLLNLLCNPGSARLAGLARFGQDSTLFRYSLLETVVEPGVSQPSVLSQGVAVDRSVVGWLLGRYQPHADLAPFVRLYAQGASREDRLLATPFEQTLNYVAGAQEPILLFYGSDGAAQKAAAKCLAHAMNKPLLSMDMGGLIASGQPVAQLFRLVLRDARLLDAVILLDEWDACLQDQEAPLFLLAELYGHPGPIVIAGRQSWQPRGMERARSILPLTFELPDYAQRKLLWRYYLDLAAGNVPQEKAPGESAGAGNNSVIALSGKNGKAPGRKSNRRNGRVVDVREVDPVEMAGQFTLSSSQIRDAVASGLDHALRRREALSQEDLYLGARMHSGVRLSDLARKITPRYSWDDIILPPDQIEILRELVATVRGRSKVLEEWGLGKKLASSAAVTVLFAGPPGTGKTMSAEVIAMDLGLDLYKIDLSNMVSKYIGETEKNLERVFTEAQSSNAILFFDEADAIFGKRAGVKDARDRYANIEVSYLLQRMEYYDGVTILATNLRSNIDEAFLRRLQFAVDIPFPDEKDRLRIWETLFPEDIPRAPNLPLDEMAKRFRLAGGNIRNVILGAAYLAAGEGTEINVQHLLHATRREFQKMGRLVPDDQL